MTSRLIALILASRRINQSDLARAAEVSRQAVSRWLSGKAGLRASNLFKLCRNLGLDPQLLLSENPLLSDADHWKRLEALYCWDQLFPSLQEFIVALSREDVRALTS